MKQDRTLNQENFDALLKWLAEDREQAGEIYEKIRSGLIRLFEIKGCNDAESLVDETISRAAFRLPTLDLNETMKPSAYFYGFAKHIYLEHRRQIQSREIPLETLAEAQSKVLLFPPKPTDKRFDCLDKCLSKLSAEENDLILGYYENDKKGTPAHRRQLAETFNLSVNNLHIKTHRIRQNLQKCLEKCLDEK